MVSWIGAGRLRDGELDWGSADEIRNGADRTRNGGDVPEVGECGRNSTDFLDSAPISI